MERKTEKVNCLICDKELEYELWSDHTGNVYNGGFMSVSFGYGSRHDQAGGFSQGRDNLIDMDKMLSCDEIEAFICDDCFDKKFNKMRGYDVVHPRVKRERIL